MARVVLAQTSFTAGELSPRVLGRTDMDRYAYGLKRCRNAYAVKHGGVVRRAGLRYIAAALSAVADASLLVPFNEGSASAWMLEFGNLQVRIRDAAGAIVTTLASPYTSADLEQMDWTQSDATLWLFHPSYPVQRLQRLGTSTWVLSPAPFTQQPFAEVGFRPAAAATLSDATVGTGRTLTAAAATFLASDVGRGVIFGAGLAVITAFTSTTVVTVQITRAFAGVALTAGAWTVDISPQTTCTPSAKDPVGSAITLTLGAAGWRAENVGAIVRINAGLCRITGFTSETVVDAVILRELSAIVAAPALSWSLEPVVWSAAYGYPRTGTIYQQRLIVAGNTLLPRTVWGSRIGELLDFERWTDDSDSFAFTIDSDDSTAIVYVTGSQELAVLTQSGEMSMRGGVEKPITPTNVRIKMESTHGCAQVRPLQINRESIFVQRAGRKVRAFGYRYDFDGFSSPDVTALSEHITASGVVSMTYAQEPEGAVWAALGDGKFISCTIDRDQQPSVLAWAKHDTDGAVECVASMPSGDTDQVWFIVRRTVNGATVRYLERLQEDWEPWPSAYTPPDGVDRPNFGFTVDCGIAFDGALASSFAVPHLVGKTVAILADGAKLPPQTVPAGGSITLPRQARKVLIGLAFESEITLLTPEVQSALGSAQGQASRTGEFYLRLLNSLPGTVQNNQGNQQVLPTRRLGPEVLAAPPFPFTGLVRVTLQGWERGDSEITVRQADPFPLHLLAAIRTHSVGGG
jgi:hypothetical protein